MRLRILDIDGSLPAQPGISEAVADGRAQYVNLRAEEFALRLWATRRRMHDLGKRLAALEPPQGTGPLVTFFGSGDYHHLTTAFLAHCCTAPVSVIHFDNHPDWVRIPATHNCGGWVNRALDLPQVARVITLGICSDDLVLPQFKAGNLPALASGRLEIHPWRAQPSRVWGAIGDGPGHRRRDAYLVWNCLADQDWPSFTDALVSRLPTEAVWVTIDKDVLRTQDAVTNWDQGQMPLETLVASLSSIATGRRIVGVDVCGEYSPPAFTDPVKRIAAWLDRPGARPPAAEDLAINDRTNRALINALSGIVS